MNLQRQLKYYYLRFVRLRGDPHELALGIALGVFIGLMPVIPFQTALAVTLAIFFKGSKITAAIGTWISNPLNWYFLYYASYKLGAFILRLPERKSAFASIVTAIESCQGIQDIMIIVAKFLGAGGAFVAAFLLGGLIMGIAFAPPAYLLFLKFFTAVKRWREHRKERRIGAHQIERKKH